MSPRPQDPHAVAPIGQKPRANPRSSKATCVLAVILSGQMTRVEGAACPKSAPLGVDQRQGHQRRTLGMMTSVWADMQQRGATPRTPGL